MRMAIWLGLAAGLVHAGGAWGAEAVIYQVPGEKGEVVGAWDVNLLADDVHFASASILREIRMPLAIAGVQTCRLWIFDALNAEAIYTAAFTNILATNQYDVHTHVFPMQLQVPKDIYVGFSAQGGGWGANAADYWNHGKTKEQGGAGTAGEYYYGPVAGGRLTTVYQVVGAFYGGLEVVAEPVQITRMEVEGNQVDLDLAMLPVLAMNILERSDLQGGWEGVEILPLGASNYAWSATNATAGTGFYRVRSE